jgi:hypothetical protein
MPSPPRRAGVRGRLAPPPESMSAADTPPATVCLPSEGGPSSASTSLSWLVPAAPDCATGCSTAEWRKVKSRPASSARRVLDVRRAAGASESHRSRLSEMRRYPGRVLRGANSDACSPVPGVIKAGGSRSVMMPLLRAKGRQIADKPRSAMRSATRLAESWRSRDRAATRGGVLPRGGLRHERRVSCSNLQTAADDTC